MKKPTTICVKQSQNFETIKRAVLNGDAALMECEISIDDLFKRGEKVAVICAVEVTQSSVGPMYGMVPFALMMNGNPYELLTPPNQNTQP